MSATVEPSAATACYYVLEGAYHGPVTEAELEALHAGGVLSDAVLVRTPLTPGWETFERWRAHRDQPAEPAQPPAGSGRDRGTDAAEADSGTGPRHACAGCRKDWPESLMLMDARRWLCRSCFFHQAMKAKRKREAKRWDWKRWLRDHWKVALALGLFLTTAGFLAWHYRRQLPFDFFDAEEPAEPWAKLPTAQWPTLAFTNYADFHGHSSLRGQGVFFVRRADNTVVAGTAAHLLTADAGVVPDMAPSELESSLRTWWAFPAGAPDRAVTLAGLQVPPAALRGFDMLFLKVVPNANTAAITPLRLAAKEAHGGAKVFVIAPAVPADPKATDAVRQTVYAGRLHVRGGDGAKGTAKEGTLLDVHVDPAFIPRHLAGTPVIDERGHLLGLVKGWGDPVDAAGHVDTIVAQGTAAFRELLEPKPATDAKSAEEARAQAAKVDQP